MNLTPPIHGSDMSLATIRAGKFHHWTINDSVFVEQCAFDLFQRKLLGIQIVKQFIHKLTNTSNNASFIIMYWFTVEMFRLQDLAKHL